jgi:type IV secretory pathway ATPase VirB11/archaellum biosynthesis ATPase
VDEEFRGWAETRDRELRDWTENRDREMREFLDALTERHVGITQQLISSIEAGFARLQAEIADQRKQIQANTAALLKVLDRLEPRGS